MIKITATELRKHLSYYLNVCESEPVYISRNGKVISCLFNPRNIEHRVNMKPLLSLSGCLKPYDDGKSYDDIMFEEMMGRYNSN